MWMTAPAMQSSHCPECLRGVSSPMSLPDYCRIAQDIAFYDKGRTGDVISRLSADVQSVSDSICLNSNVLSRSALQV